VKKFVLESWTRSVVVEAKDIFEAVRKAEGVIHFRKGYEVKEKA